MVAPTTQAIDAVRSAAHAFQRGSLTDYDPLMELIGDAPLVLLGEASHGTHEFYDARARLTRRLITEKGFTAVAVEADWPDAYRVNRYVRGGRERSSDPDAHAALSGFRRFPLWMWRNQDVLAFVEWLHEHNLDRPADERAGFYGLDLYSLYASIEAVIEYLDRVDPEAARRARDRYACFEDANDDPGRYGYAASIGAQRPCEDEAVQQLMDLRRQADDYLRRDGMAAEDEQFYAEQNARLIRNAEAYYRAMFGRRQSSWNLRDQHMAETLAALWAHLARGGRAARIVVWAHNSHIGDARATQMGRGGELNIGQLARQRYGRDAVLIGFTTHHGSVTAAANWDAPAERMRVRPALPGSYEALFYHAGLERFILPLREPSVADALRPPRLERAIGVIYRPGTERASHYFDSQLSDQFDAVVHFDETHAVEPLDDVSEWQQSEAPETYPYGL